MIEKSLAQLNGIGLGPGQSGFLTLQAAKILMAVDIVFTPVPRHGEKSLAASIMANSGVFPKKIFELEFPMSRDKDVLNKAWSRAVEPILEAIEAGKTTAFITLGDPSVYSTWIYLRRAVELKRPTTSFYVVPGIMAANAAAARLGVPLCEGTERFALLPLPVLIDELDDFLALVDKLVIYKIAERLSILASWVEKHGLEKDAFLVSRVGLENEQAGLLVDLANRGEGYLSVAIISTKRRLEKV